MTAKTSRKKHSKSDVDYEAEKNNTLSSDAEVTASETVPYENHRMELLIRFPKLKCYKRALEDLVNTDKPVQLSSNLSFTTIHTSRTDTESSLEKFKNIEIGSECIRSKLTKEGESVHKKRVVLVPRRAHFKEAVQVLKQTYGAKDVDCTKKGTDNHLYTMEFETEDDALKAESRPQVIYHGLELVVGASIGPKKRPLEVTPSKENASKRAKIEGANGESTDDKNEATEDTEKSKLSHTGTGDDDDEAEEEEEAGDEEDVDKEGGEEDMDEEADDDSDEDEDD